MFSSQWVRNPAKTSCIRAYNRRSSLVSSVHAFTSELRFAQLSVSGDDSHLLLARQRFFADLVPSFVELALVHLDVLLCHVMRRVPGAVCQIE